MVSSPSKLNTFEMKPKAKHIALLLFSSLLLTGQALAQRISFGLYTSDDLTITPSNFDGLNFNTKQHAIVPGQTITINRTDIESAIFTITARQDQDLTINIDAPANLSMDEFNSIPLVLRFAYSNSGVLPESNAKSDAIEVPLGFTSVTFPMRKRLSGLPIPPPTPNLGKNTAPTDVAYLIIFGTLGPIANIAAGQYTGTISIRVEYAK